MMILSKIAERVRAGASVDCVRVPGSPMWCVVMSVERRTGHVDAVEVEGALLHRPHPFPVPVWKGTPRVKRRVPTCPECLRALGLPARRIKPRIGGGRTATWPQWAVALWLRGAMPSVVFRRIRAARRRRQYRRRTR